jgi:ElaB/YqjD/DUF883 family membrane-anchored ribosome-binding protein
VSSTEPESNAMNTRNDSLKHLGDEAASVARAVAQSTEQMVHSAKNGLDRMADGLDAARNQSGTAFKQFAHQTEALAHDGMVAVREGAHQLREKSLHAKDATTAYIQQEPVKSVLMAAAVGAALMGLVALLARHSGPGR